MRLLGKDLEKDGGGSISLRPETLEDMWHAYNLISEGDLVRATTVRRVQERTTTGTSKSERVRMTLTIQVEKIEFDPDSGVLRLNGTNRSENEYVRMGAYHTLDLEMNRKFILTKRYWDSVALERIDIACDPTKYADLAAIIMTEGLATVCLINSSMTIVRARVEAAIPRKRRGSSAEHDKVLVFLCLLYSRSLYIILLFLSILLSFLLSPFFVLVSPFFFFTKSYFFSSSRHCIHEHTQQGLKKFFEATMQAILRHINFDVVKCVIIASPGFVKDQFNEYMNGEAIKRELKVLMENKDKFVLAHSTSGHKHALREILTDPLMQSKLEDTKAAGEVRVLAQFYEMMKIDPDRAFYGLSDVVLAQDRLAIETLLLTDELFRASDIATRKKYVNLVESVKALGGNVQIFSTLHVSGEQLKQLGGIAAILRFPLPDVAGMEDEGDEDEEDEEEEDEEGEKVKEVEL
ncbi:Translation factor pelota [Balamuthia mandrillaris]